MIPILIRSLALTLAAELLTGAFLGLRRWDEVRTLLLMNLATNPPAVFAIALTRKFWAPGPAAALFFAVEVLVWLAETGLLRLGAELSLKRAMWCSLVLNGVSCALGQLF